MHLVGKRQRLLVIDMPLIAPSLLLAVTAVKASPGSALRAAADDPLLRYQWHISNRASRSPVTSVRLQAWTWTWRFCMSLAYGAEAWAWAW